MSGKQQARHSARVLRVPVGRRARGSPRISARDVRGIEALAQRHHAIESGRLQRRGGGKSRARAASRGCDPSASGNEAAREGDAQARKAARAAGSRRGRSRSAPRTLREPRSTGPKEPRAPKRWRREYPSSGRSAASRPLDGDALAALGAARIDDGAAAGRFHAHAKAVRLLPMGCWKAGMCASFVNVP